MSDLIYKIIPSDYTFLPEREIEGVIELIKLYIKAEKISWKKCDNPEFIDCGDNFKTVSCPICGSDIEMDIWKKMMSEAYEKSNFNDLSINLNCCNNSSTLNDLKYDMPCGFAKLVIEILNPEYPPCQNELHEVNKCFGKHVSLKMVQARY